VNLSRFIPTLPAALSKLVPNKSLGTTPAMGANVTKRLWEIDDIVDVLEAWEAINVGSSAV
jgi:hypothetical protein